MEVNGSHSHPCFGCTFSMASFRLSVSVLSSNLEITIVKHFSMCSYSTSSYPPCEVKIQMRKVLWTKKGFSKLHATSDTEATSKQYETFHRPASTNCNCCGSHRYNWWNQAIRFSENMIEEELCMDMQYVFMTTNIPFSLRKNCVHLN